MPFCFNAPFNSVSFGQVSTALARELFRRDSDCSISPIGGNADFGSQNLTQDFVEWFSNSSKTFSESHSRDDPTFKLWHLNGGMEAASKKLVLFSFHELDSSTKAEANIAKNCDAIAFSSQDSVDLFKGSGANAHYIPLAFDADNFRVTERKYHDDDIIVFNLSGKFEKRKHHEKVLKAWAKKYGDDNKYRLQCAIFNPFFSKQDNAGLINRALDSRKYFNISFLPTMALNTEYNDYLNSSEIVIGMSGGEGWGLPEFQSVALGKHAVILNAHGYKGWANESNSVLVEPSGKTSAEDGVFFKEGGAFNDGSIHDFNEDDFINGCEEAIKRVSASKVNQEGVKLQEQFPVSKSLDKILELL